MSVYEWREVQIQRSNRISQFLFVSEKKNIFNLWLLALYGTWRERRKWLNKTKQSSEENHYEKQSKTMAKTETLYTKTVQIRTVKLRSEGRECLTLKWEKRDCRERERESGLVWCGEVMLVRERGKVGNKEDDNIIILKKE